MQPAEFDLSLYRGDTFRLQLKLWEDQAASLPVDLTGATADSQIRNKPGGDIIVPLAATVTAPSIIDAVLLATDAASLPKRRGAWDLQVTSGDVFSPVAGKVSIKEDITRALSTTVEAAAITDVTTLMLDLFVDQGIWSLVRPAALHQQLPLPPAPLPPERRLLIEEAPKDGTPYVRQDGRWIPLSVALHGEEI
jgi:hypothetical protein